VGIAVRTDPDAARLEIDGEQVSNPFAKGLTRDLRAHTITASAPGFAATTETVTFDRDRELVLRLVRATSKGTAPAEQGAGAHGTGGRKNRGPGGAKVENPSGDADAHHSKAAGYRGSKLNIETEFPGTN
jgi:hypothetical protein